MKALLVALAASLTLATAASAQQSAGTLDSIQRTKTIRLGYLLTAFPFSFADNQKLPSGFSVELCDRVADSVKAQLGLDKLEVKWVPVTLENRFELVASGIIDLECGTSTNTLARQKLVDFSLPIWVDGGNFIAKTGSDLRNLFALEGKKVGVSSGTTTEKVLAEALEKKGVRAQIVHVKDHVEGMNALYQGRIDAYSADQTVLLSLALAAGNQMQVSMGEQYFSYEPYGLVLRRNDADFRLAVNAALARIYRKGQIAFVYDHWFGRMGKPSEILVTTWAISALPE